MKNIFTILRGLWLTLAMGCLTYSVLMLLEGQKGEARIPAILGMLALSAPLGFAIIWIIGAVMWGAYALFPAPWLSSIDFTSEIVGLLILAASGYWQWFYLFPWLTVAIAKPTHPPGEAPPG